MTIEVSWFVANMTGLWAPLNEIVKVSEILKSKRFGLIGDEYLTSVEDTHANGMFAWKMIDNIFNTVRFEVPIPHG